MVMRSLNIVTEMAGQNRRNVVLSAVIRAAPCQRAASPRGSPSWLAAWLTVIALYRAHAARVTIAAALLFAVATCGASRSNSERPGAADQMVAASEGGKVERGCARQGVQRLRAGLRQRPGHRRVRQDRRLGDGRRFGAALNVRSLIGRSCRRSLFVAMVPRRGLEPPRCYPLVPETSASTNSATWALSG